MYFLHFYPLLLLVLGQPCVCQFSFDQKWYRAQIIELLDDDTVKVKYVDYGNIEAASKKR